MPLFLLVAIFLAFGFEASSGLGPFPRPLLVPRLSMVSAGVVLIVALAFALGQWIARSVARRGHATASLRRQYIWGSRILEVLSLVVYGWIIHGLEWPGIVQNDFRLRGVLVADDVLVLLPYVVMQLATWWGTYAAERAFRSSSTRNPASSLRRHMGLRIRQTLGLVLPVLLVFSLGQDIVRRQWPRWSSNAWSQPAEVAVMGILILSMSPLFVRLAWPTRPLAPGPLRDRLERLAQRLGFRCSDILVWDTGQVVVNACVTGPLPWFRYILLSDALIEYLDEYEIAAVFGHEVGHIAHRHLAYFGFFFVASLGVVALFNTAIDARLTAFSRLCAGQAHPTLAAIIEATLALLAIGLYFLVVFGHVSRRFERQADVFGCLAVSCGQSDCPPHADLDRSLSARSAPAVVCPVGIRIFANALSSVALLNGMEPRARSWRHGSIARRIAFLEGLEGRPEALRRFQRGVRRLRLFVALVLVGVVLAALATGTIDYVW